MKITKSQLKQIIKEELEGALDEKMGLPPEVEVHSDSPEGVRRKCKELRATYLDMHKCVADPAAYEEERKRLRSRPSWDPLEDPDEIRRRSGWWPELEESKIRDYVKEELETVLDEGLWGDVKAGLGIGGELEKRLAANPNYGSSKAEIKRRDQEKRIDQIYVNVGAIGKGLKSHHIHPLTNYIKELEQLPSKSDGGSWKRDFALDLATKLKMRLSQK